MRNAMTADVEVAVVGRGMIGAAAGRHLAEAGTATALVGPDEPRDRRASDGPFSSHPDEGRITRVAARTDVWAEIAARSIARYDDIATRSGIAFHSAVGLVSVFETAAEWVERGRRFGTDARLVDAEWARSETGIDVRNGLPIMWEGPPAGHINPRRLVAAQTELAKLAGATVIRDAATALDRTTHGFRLGGGWGSITAHRVLVATGAFGSELLDVELDVERRPRSVLMAELAPLPDVGVIPSLILDRPADDRLEEIYWVPPVTYPDGVARLKIGGNLRSFEPLHPDDLTDWFHSNGSSTELEALEISLRALLPDYELVGLDSSPCVITGTATGHPYVGWIDDGLAVALGGNGSAAKSSDELGRLAASLFDDDGWTDSLDPGVFAPRLL